MAIIGDKDVDVEKVVVKDLSTQGCEIVLLEDITSLLSSAVYARLGGQSTL